MAGKVLPDFASIETREAEVSAPVTKSRKLDPEGAKAGGTKAAATPKPNQVAKVVAELHPQQKPHLHPQD